MCQVLTLDISAAVAAYADAMEDAVRAFASTLAEPCCRAKVIFLRPDGTEIDVVDVMPVTPASDSPGL